MPALALSQPTRQMSYRTALSYYGAALWPIILAAKNCFGPEVSVLAALVLWVSATAILAVVWPLVWTADRRQAIWGSPVALLLTVLPPLGIIGFASPLTAAGFLFPALRGAVCWLCAVLSGVLAAWPRKAANGIVCLVLVANTLHFNDPEPPSGWQGVNTHFGAIAHGRVHPGNGVPGRAVDSAVCFISEREGDCLPGKLSFRLGQPQPKRSGNKRSIAYARAEKRSSLGHVFRSAGISVCSRVRTTSRQTSPLSMVDARVFSRAARFSEAECHVRI